MSVNMLEARKKRGMLTDIACTAMDFFSIWADAVSDISMDINSIPGVGPTVGVATSTISAVSHLTKAGTEMTKVALGCDDIPFEEIKEIMMAKFADINRKLELNNREMEKVVHVATQAFKLAEKTQMEMRRGFRIVLNELNNVIVQEKIHQISNFAEFFQTESRRINTLPTEEYIAKLEEEDSILFLLKDSRTPKVESLYSAMNDIILNDDAIPKNENDSTAFQTLFALFYGAQTYVSLLGFLMKSHTYLVDYYYLNGDYEKYNEGIDTLTITLDDFKSSLLDETSGIITKIGKVLEKVQNKGFIKKVKSSLFKQVAAKTKVLEIFKEQINKISLPIIEDVPLTPWMQFDQPNFNTPIVEWKDGAIVQYAAQFEENGRFSKLSEWSDLLTIRNKAFVSVSSTEGGGRKKLIFRKFNDDPPELVYKLNNQSKAFRDQFRDFYNAAGYPDTDLGLDVAKQVLLCCGALNSECSYELGRTAFHNIAKSNNVELFNYLKEFGSVENKNIRDAKGYTPLHIAAEHGSKEMMSQLFQHRANPSLTTYTEGYTPLHLAVLHGMEDSIKMLVERPGVKINAVDKNGFTPLHLTVSSGSHLIDLLMKDKEINLNAKSKTGLTILHLAAIQGEFEFFNILKNRNVNVNEVDMNNLTPLHYAALTGNEEMVEKMLSQIKNLNVNIPGKNNKWTPLHYAIFFKKTDTALNLIKYSKTNVNAKASNDVSPLHMAASTGQHDLVKKLLNKKADKNAKTKEGNTPLHFSAMNDCELCADYLVGKGAAINAKNNKNETPVDLASKFGEGDLAKILKSKAGKRYRRNSELDFNINSTPSLSDEIVYPGKQLEASHNETNYKSKFLLGMHSDTKVTKPLNLSWDGNGTLMLMDLLLRKLNISSKKNNTSIPGSLPELEAQLRALDITDKFEKFLNLLSDVPVRELINLVELSSKVKKALMSDHNKEVIDTLCLFVDNVESSTPQDIENIMETFKLKEVILNGKNATAEEVLSIMKKTCIKSKAAI